MAGLPRQANTYRGHRRNLWVPVVLASGRTVLARRLNRQFTAQRVAKTARYRGVRGWSDAVDHTLRMVRRLVGVGRPPGKQAHLEPAHVDKIKLHRA